MYVSTIAIATVLIKTIKSELRGKDMPLQNKYYNTNEYQILLQVFFIKNL